MRKKYTVCIIGTPNCGKTTIFNRLTGQNKNVGNWVGVTVDQCRASIAVDDLEIEFVDLPGLYSLSIFKDEATSDDEKLSIKFLTERKFDFILNVVNSTNIKLNLYLSSQLAEMGIPMAIAVNMIDKVKNKGPLLKQFADLPIIDISAKRNADINKLLQFLIHKLKNTSAIPVSDIIKHYSEDIGSLIEKAINLQRATNPAFTVYDAMQVLEAVHKEESKNKRPMLDSSIMSHISILEKKYGHDIELILLEARYQFVDKMLGTEIKLVKRAPLDNFIDSILLHKFFGPILFAVIMYLLFTFSITFGSFFQDHIQMVERILFVTPIEEIFGYLDSYNKIFALILEGVGSGVRAVIDFIPVIAGLYVFLSFLEESGYMARAAFLMNNFMNKLGLPGKAIVPLIIGFGCNVPSILSTRVLDSKQHKVLVSMMVPFMSCSARLSVFTALGSIFFAQNSQNLIFLLYLLGIFFAILTGYIVKRSVGSNFQSLHLAIELPEYTLPSVKSILSKTYRRLLDFVIGAGKLIVTVCFLLHLANSITPDGHIVQDSFHDDSILSTVSKKAIPIFRPMGIQDDNWPAVVGIFSGLLAKEVVMGTLNSLYSTLEDDGYNLNPDTILQARFRSQSTAFAYLLFILLYFPCISVFAVIKREIGLKWALISSVWTTCLAYSVSTIFYQIANFSHYNEYSVLYIVSASLLLAGSAILLLNSAKTS